MMKQSLKEEEGREGKKKMMINTANDALLYCCRTLEDDELKQVIYKNRFGHRAFITHLGTKYYVIYKEEPFKSYGRMTGTGEGFGDSINKDYLENTINIGIHFILFCYKEGSVYSINPKKLKDIAVERKQELNDEITYSFSLKELERWDK